MLAALRRRHDPELTDDEGGFTLIELMVVVLIIAILIAIAIPTFFGAQDKAKKSAAQSNLRNAVSSVKVMAADFEGQFLKADGSAAATVADIQALEKSIKWVDGATVTPKAGQVGVVVTSEDEIAMFATAKSDEWYGVVLQSSGAAGYCKVATAADAKAITKATCADDAWT